MHNNGGNKFSAINCTEEIYKSRRVGVKEAQKEVLFTDHNKRSRAGECPIHSTQWSFRKSEMQNRLKDSPTFRGVAMVNRNRHKKLKALSFTVLQK